VRFPGKDRKPLHWNCFAPQPPYGTTSMHSGLQTSKKTMDIWRAALGKRCWTRSKLTANKTSSLAHRKQCTVDVFWLLIKVNNKKITQNVRSSKRTLPSSLHQSNGHTSRRNGKVSGIALWPQTDLERTHCKEKETTRSQNTGDKMAHRKKLPPITRKQNTHLQNGSQTFMELWNWAVGMRQQI
jgi:hypothetical protein